MAALELSSVHDCQLVFKPVVSGQQRSLYLGTCYLRIFHKIVVHILMCALAVQKKLAVICLPI